jgi:hypothetical protein
MSQKEDTSAVTIYTPTFRIEGSIALLPGARLTDFIRGAQEFIAVTGATAFDRDGNRLFTVPFLDVGRSYVELILPAESQKK